MSVMREVNLYMLHTFGRMPMIRLLDNQNSIAFQIQGLGKKRGTECGGRGGYLVHNPLNNGIS